jgi:hypothetical protein
MASIIIYETVISLIITLTCSDDFIKNYGGYIIIFSLLSPFPFLILLLFTISVRPVNIS